MPGDTDDTKPEVASNPKEPEAPLLAGLGQKVNVSVTVPVKQDGFS